MDPLSAVAAGSTIINGLGTLFGKRRRNPYGAQQQAAMGNLTGIASRYGRMADRAFNDYNAYAPQRRQAVNRLSDYYSADPWTSQNQSAYLNRATQGIETGRQAAEAGLTADLARRGITDSGVMAGSLAGLRGRASAAYAGARNDLALRRIADEERRLRASADLWQDEARDARSFGMGTLGNAASVNQGLAGMGFDQQRYADARADSQAAGQGDTLGLLAQLLYRNRAQAAAPPAIGSGAGLPPPQAAFAGYDPLTLEPVQPRPPWMSYGAAPRNPFRNPL